MDSWTTWTGYKTVFHNCTDSSYAATQLPCVIAKTIINEDEVDNNKPSSDHKDIDKDLSKSL